MPEIDEHVGARIKLMREQARLSLSGLAEQAQVSKGYLWSLEKGDVQSRPSGKTLYRIAKALGTTMSDLLGHDLLVDPPREIPESLRKFAALEQLAETDVQMLAAVNFRGQQPQDTDSWALIWQAIKHASVRR